MVLVSVLHTAVLVLQVWCCVVKHDLVTLAGIMILKDTATFQVLFIVSLFWSSAIRQYLALTFRVMHRKITMNVWNHQNPRFILLFEN